MKPGYALAIVGSLIATQSYAAGNLFNSPFGSSGGLSANVSVTSNLSVAGNEDVTGTLKVGGASTLTGLLSSANISNSANLSVAGALDVTGTSKFGGLITANGSIATGGLTVTGNTSATNISGTVIDATTGAATVTATYVYAKSISTTSLVVPSTAASPIILNGTSTSQGSQMQFNANSSQIGGVGSVNAVVTGGVLTNFGLSSNNAFVIGTGGSLTSRLFIASTGQVGIGTSMTTPSATVHVSGTMMISATGNVGGVAACTKGQIAWAPTYNSLAVCQGATGWAPMISATTLVSNSAL